MVNLVKVDSFGRGGRQGIMSRKECAVRIAAILSEWAMVETYLANMLAAAMGSHTMRDDGLINIAADWNSRIIMGEIESIHMRLRIVDCTLLPRLTSELADEWESLKKKIRGGAKQRNLCAHASWIFSEAYPEDLLLETSSGYHRYQARDFDEILDRMANIYGETWHFQNKVLAAIRSGDVRILGR